MKTKAVTKEWPTDPQPILVPQRFGLLDPESKTHVSKLVRMVDARFRLSAKAWERGQNSGSPEFMELMNTRSDRLGSEGAAMLAPLGVKCTWPGLYPAFAVKGFTEYSTLCAVLAALGKPRNWILPEECK